ncbi:Small-conductance mechanosensitive channel [Desulfuromusa kysingii]|uniref:Small-conductance mechanosensitive channel n=2 Tax=Desulfuromusa kysingii TaxID=37625 RepID=A0A1H3XNQ5_9BACT|nr:Small-conductance mechanosensitive channel [Desulfuromusa kysingii]
MLLCLGLMCPPSALAEGVVTRDAFAADEIVQPAVFPGLSELGSRSSALADFAARSEERLQLLTDLSKQKESLTEISEHFKNLTAEIKPLGSPDHWYVDRLTQYLNQFNKIRQDLDALQQKITLRQQEVEGIRAQVIKDKEFWYAWSGELEKQDVAPPQQTMALVKKLLEQLQASLHKTAAPLLQLQEQIGTFHRDVSAASDNLTLALGKLRKATFRKNAYSFGSGKFYRQFNSELRNQTKDGLTAALKFNKSYLQENGWLLGLMIITFSLILSLLHHYRSKLQETDEWHFIIRHSWAAASFFTIIAFWFWFPAPPPLIRFVFLLLAAISATSLAIPLLENRRQAWVLSLTALVIFLTSAFRLIALPQPLFRIYIALLAVIFIPLLVQQLLLSKKSRQSGEGRLYRALMRLVVAVLGVSLIGQIAGYMNFSNWLIQATFETGMVLLFAKMAVMLIAGGIELTTDLLIQSGQSFFREFGEELAVRLKRLLNFLIYSFLVLYLLPVWRLFATVSDGWNYFSQWTIVFGNFHLSMQMLVSAVITFYLSLQISWVLQGFSETEVLIRHDVDRGVRDAVKKLIHYGVVLIGFLVALSLLGLSLQHFVVVLGAFGVGIGFGLQDIVNNFLSGLILLFERPIKVGDGVLIDGEYGTVSRIGLRSTVVKNMDEAELIVPNAQMISQKVTNWTLTNRRVRIVLSVGVAYGSDLEKVLTILTEVSDQHPLVLKKPKPSPLFVQFGDSSLDFELRVWISNIDNRPDVKNELLLAIDRRFREAEVEIPFPQQDLHLRSVDSGILPTPERE